MPNTPYDLMARGRKYAAQRDANTRGRQLAAAFLLVARADHYMVGIVAPYTPDELDEAEQALIEYDNARGNRNKAGPTPEHKPECLYRRAVAIIQAQIDAATDAAESDTTR